MSKPTVWWHDAGSGQERESVTVVFNAETGIATVGTDVDPRHTLAVPKAQFTFINLDAREAWQMSDVPVRVDPADARKVPFATELMRELSGAAKPPAYETWRLQYIADVGGAATRVLLKQLYPDAGL